MDSPAEVTVTAIDQVSVTVGTTPDISVSVGVQGPPGPSNSISVTTQTSIDGVLKGSSGLIASAIPGTDFETAGTMTAHTSAYDHTKIATALQPVNVPVSLQTATISAGALSLVLDPQLSYVVELNQDVTDFSTTLLTGADTATKMYGTTVRFTAPTSGGPFSVTIPTSYRDLIGSSVSLSAGDEDAILSVWTTPSGGREYVVVGV